MSLASNITRRSGSTRYYARQWVPKELQGVLKKTEVWKSLGTSDPKEAKKAARIVLQQWEREFTVLLVKRKLTEHELQTAIWNRYSELVKADEQKRLELVTDRDQDDIKIRPATMNQSRTVVDLFSQFVGRHFPASRISKKEVREWRLWSTIRLRPLKPPYSVTWTSIRPLQKIARFNGGLFRKRRSTNTLLPLEASANG